jgi:hypothetical protein
MTRRFSMIGHLALSPELESGSWTCSTSQQGIDMLLKVEVETVF